MARIRIVDEWLRSPVSPPSRQRAILVIARSWAEQRVLMRAFAECEDQTRPTITLQGARLSIGPAGVDPHGEWGIHVEPPVDGRAQELREALELAAKLLAGSKGNPPRLADEVPEFEGKATNHWAPGSGQQLPAAKPAYYEPAVSAPPSNSKDIPSSAQSRMARTHFRKTPPFWGETYETPELQAAPPSPAEALQQGQATGGLPNIPKAQPMAMAAQPATATRNRKMRQTFRYSGVVTAQRPESSDGPANKKQAAKTAHGYSSAKRQYETYAATAGKTMPLGFKLGEAERRVLDALGKQSSMTATEIGVLLGLPDPMTWMSSFMDKLAEFGLDLVTPGDDRDGEPTYILSR